MGSLYIVALPIGNMEDITLRALRILKSVHYILAEDTRIFRKIADHYHISTPVRSFELKTEKRKAPYVIEDLKNNQDIALVCDRGTPLISDPGGILVKKARKEGILVDVIPGASAITTFLPYLSITNFIFIGFFRLKKFAQYVHLNTPIIFFESPHRIKKTLILLQEKFEIKNITIGRELTKKFQEIIQGFEIKITKGEFIITVTPIYCISSSIEKIIDNYHIPPSQIKKLKKEIKKILPKIKTHDNDLIDPIYQS